MFAPPRAGHRDETEATVPVGSREAAFYVWAPPAPLGDPRIEGNLSTGVAALRGSGTGRLLSHGRFGCGSDRLQSRQVPAQGRASWLGERDLPPRT